MKIKFEKHKFRNYFSNYHKETKFSPAKNTPQKTDEEGNVYTFGITMEVEYFKDYNVPYNLNFETRGEGVDPLRRPLNRINWNIFNEIKRAIYERIYEN